VHFFQATVRVLRSVPQLSPSWSWAAIGCQHQRPISISASIQPTAPRRGAAENQPPKEEKGTKSYRWQTADGLYAATTKPTSRHVTTLILTSLLFLYIYVNKVEHDPNDVPSRHKKFRIRLPIWDMWGDFGLLWRNLPDPHVTVFFIFTLRPPFQQPPCRSMTLYFIAPWSRFHYPTNAFCFFFWKKKSLIRSIDRAGFAGGMPPDPQGRLRRILGSLWSSAKQN
jgi:hypothetical protein